jgi:hypothetical protein
MNHTPDLAAGNGDSFSPEQAAALLNQTTQQARRQLQPAQVWLLIIRGIVVLGVLGAVWLNTRGQHPYQHPTATVVPFVIIFGIHNLTATLTVRMRATSGVKGKSQFRPIEIAILALVWIAAYVALGVMAGAGVRESFVFGQYPVSVPLIAAGLAWAIISGLRANWLSCGTGVAVAVTGALALAASPSAAWAVAGVGLCVTLLSHAAVLIRQQRRTVVGS